MKLILFADRLPPLIGGMEIHAHYFVQYFKGRYDFNVVSKVDGRDCLVDFEYMPIKNIELEKYLSAFGSEKTVLFFNSGRWIEQMKSIRDLLPEAVIMYRTGGNEIIQAPLSCRMPIYAERRKFWKDTINYSVDYLITNSDFTDMRLKQFGISENIIRKIPGGVDKDIIRNAIDKRNETRARYGITDSDKLIVSCTRFVPYKRADFLMDAVSLCKSKAALIIAGGGPLEDTVKRQAAHMQYPVKILPALSHSHAVQLIAAADVYAQASCDYEKSVEGGSYIHTEGMGRSLIEAVCCGVPVTVTKCGAVEEFINADNGAVVSSKEAMAAAIDKFLSDKPPFMPNNAAYLERYSFDTIFERYISLWE